MAKNNNYKGKGNGKKTEAPEEKKDYVKLMSRYDMVNLAGNLLEDKGRMPYAIQAMKDFYFSTCNLEKDDPIMNNVFAEAQAGLAKGHFSSPGLLKAIEVYSGKFKESYVKAKVSDIIQYTKERGFDEIPSEVMALIDKYASNTYEELFDSAKKEKDKNKKNEMATVLQALQALQTQSMEGNLYPKLVKNTTIQNLESLIETEEDKPRKRAR